MLNKTSHFTLQIYVNVQNVTLHHVTNTLRNVTFLQNETNKRGKLHISMLI